MKFERKRDIIKERNHLLGEIKRKNKIIEELEGKLRGDIHNTGMHCIGCENCIEENYGFYPQKICKLDIKCKDRVEK